MTSWDKLPTEPPPDMAIELQLLLVLIAALVVVSFL